MAIENLTLHAYAYPEEGAEGVRVVCTGYGDDGYVLLDLPPHLAEKLRDGLTEALLSADELARGLTPTEEPTEELRRIKGIHEEVNPDNRGFVDVPLPGIQRVDAVIGRKRPPGRHRLTPGVQSEVQQEPSRSYFVAERFGRFQGRAFCTGDAICVRGRPEVDSSILREITEAEWQQRLAESERHRAEMFPEAAL